MRIIGGTLKGKNILPPANYGARPTFDNVDVLTETYLDGFSGDLYGKKCKVEFIRFLRDVQKFDSVEELKEQLNKDVRRVKTGD